jgi:F-type H+-transporting ATPase subunit c
MMDHSIIALGVGITMLGACAAAIGLGMLFTAWINAIARNPAVEAKVKGPGMIGFAAIELVLLLCFVVAFLLIGKIG